MGEYIWTSFSKREKKNKIGLRQKNGHSPTMSIFKYMHGVSEKIVFVIDMVRNPKKYVLK